MKKIFQGRLRVAVLVIEVRSLEVRKPTFH
jgi:hypothetical protein